ncbi:Hypothetical predicted protein [Octopus vulgaris]|uniref:Uncharacterized protein n=1 Tax=Octopus vulgaris TaxID=6645 RepID=A0AA36C015_OCTVU|nr:Hypothetical predicted protein [Octopus vulgaris]
MEKKTKKKRGGKRDKEGEQEHGVENEEDEEAEGEKGKEDEEAEKEGGDPKSQEWDLARIQRRSHTIL